MLCHCPLADALLIFLETGSCFQPGQQSETLSQKKKQNKTTKMSWRSELEALPPLEHLVGEEKQGSWCSVLFYKEGVDPERQGVGL
ncbi:hypothetical protein H8957_005386, partial [Semnopithecus entellus]